MNKPWKGKLYHDRELHADWGWIRDEDGHLIMKVLLPILTEAQILEHRKNKTDPCQERVDAILAAINGTDVE